MSDSSEPDSPVSAADVQPPVPVALEMELPPGQARRLARLLHLKGGRAIPRPVIWHDSPDFALAGRRLVLGLSREGRGERWRMSALRPWAGAPEEPRCEASSLDLLAEDLPEGLRAVASFVGRRRVLSGAGLMAEVCTGRLCAGGLEQPCCRVRLAGPAEAVRAAALRLATVAQAQVVARALAEEALAMAGAEAVVPELPELIEGTVGEAFTLLLAALTATLLVLAPRVGLDDDDPVHEMRVAVRRLRSAIRLFRRALGGEELAAASRALRELAQVLAPPRSWDVFLAGTGQALLGAFPDRPEVTRLLAAAERRRRRVYAQARAWLDGPAARSLAVELALLAAWRPWERPPTEEEARRRERLATPVRAFAVHVLRRRIRPLHAAGDRVKDLPVAELHALRLDCKRMRYAVEFFAPLFPRRESRRMLRRLVTVQDAIGELNDGAGIADLLDELGLARGHVGGLVSGFVAAQGCGTRGEIARAWRRLIETDPFWK